MNDLVLIVIVLIIGGILYPKVLRPRLEKKIKNMETELQKRKEQ